MKKLPLKNAAAFFHYGKQNQRLLTLIDRTTKEVMTVEKEEFAARVQGIRGKLYRAAFMLLGNETDALEAVDEAVYQALRNLKQLRHEEFFETWLTRILINTCHKELRHRKHFFKDSTETLPESATEDDYDQFPLREAVQRLPEELRTVVVLRFFAGYTQVETAESLQIPQGTVATRQKRALRLLRLELGEEAMT